MRRIGRYILNGLTVLSLGLCVAMLALWPRSYYREYELRWNNGRGIAVDATISRGALGLALFGADLSDANARDRWYAVGDPGFAFRSSEPTDLYANLDAWSIQRRMPGARYVAVISPHISARLLLVRLWTMIALTLIGPVSLAIVRISGRERRSDGRCSKCGYDLRATPDRCPECGTIPTKVKA